MRFRTRQMAWVLIAWLLVGAFGQPCRGADWPMFGRDQSRNPVSPEKNAPTSWCFSWNAEERTKRPNQNIRWATTLTAPTYRFGSYGDPVVVDGMVWVGTNNYGARGSDRKDAAVLACLDEESGKILYRYVSPRISQKEDQWGLDWPGHSMACSPLIEGDRLWFTTNRCEVVCLDIGPLRKRQGDPGLVWKVDMCKDLGVSPVGCLFNYRLCSVASYKELLFVITNNGVGYGVKKVPAPDAPSLVCFNKHTGNVVWKDNLPGKDILFSQFASPTIIDCGGKIQVVAPQGDGWVRSFEAATGKLLWKFDTNPPDAKWDRERPAFSTRNYLPATAVFHANRVYIGNGQEVELYGRLAWLYCIDPTKSGNISPYLTEGPDKGKPNPNSGMVWKYGGVDKRTEHNKFNSTVSNVAVAEGLVIAPDSTGEVHCLDSQTGQRYWVHDTDGGSIEGNPLIVDGKIYVEAGFGVCILALAKEKKVLGTIEMDWSAYCSPIFANGVLYVTTGTTIFAIAGDKKDPKK